jgi:hypothetical protein
MERRVAVVAVAVLAGAVALATVAAAAPGPGSGPDAIAGSDLSPDDTALRVSVAPDGDASWAVAYRVRLDDENTTTAFESLRADVAANGSRYAEPFASRTGATAAAAENRTGREMAVRNVSVTATRRQLPAEYGVVTYRFDWTGFAATDGGRLQLGDALAGLFLDDRTTLLVAWPAPYEPTAVEPEPDERRDRAVVWTGPVEFGPGEPSVALAPVAGTTAASGTDSGGGTGPDAPGGPTPSPATVALAVTVVGIGLVGAGLWWRRRDGSAGTTADERDPTDDTAGERDPTDDGDGSAATDPPSELLSNEERVVELLDRNGGRMRQQEVASALDWTDAKTSQVVTSMREAGDLDSFRLGRENVLTLPDEER